MRQLFLSNKGRIVVQDAPEPELTLGGMLSHTCFSLISPGTEGHSYRNAKRNPADGPEKFNPMGYSSAGKVVEVGQGITDIQVGDRIAGSGSGGFHAAVNFVPKHLMTPLPDSVSLEEGTFTSLGSIAIHGIRRANVTLCETFVVVGLGIIGQLVCQLLRCASVNSIGVDLLESRLVLARKLGTSMLVNASDTDFVEKIKHMTAGVGADGVIICAGSPESSAPLVSALEMVRDKGRIVIVGNVKLEFPRYHFYHKEIDLLISRSYGPGRYDPRYEEEGHDYPLGYVRWTENRNMRQFVSLIAQGKIDVKSLITTTFSIEEGERAFDLVVSDSEAMMAVLLKY